jgi:hypothetical protein
MAKVNVAPTVKWVIDTHGMLAALRSRTNSSKVAIIDAIECGEMQLLKGVSKELCELYPDEYEDFKQIKNKKYMQITVPTMEAAGVLMQRYGSSIWGSIPGKEHFHSLAAAMKAGCKLVTSGKAHSNCNSIVKRCNLADCLLEAEAF